ncbi:MULTISPECIES: HAD-IA family hydrolase [Oceanobacillus]|uniref:HAD-IA family hydrolase n=1 Tax=Oceanobacillus aidingensis TaxID=645964 RepID=A0ABV9K131_9BACI|nr:HAD-IA family hydrolase [Oceanobacillus oncorhynchi]MDM8101857.1 HAD-IA family hydrolase [Oceanobacillus oncorhynchi]
MKSVIFDMDGTLFQTDKILELSLEDTFTYLASLGKWGGSIPIDKFREIMGVPLPVVWETLLSNHSVKEREQINDYFQDRLIENIKNGKGALYPNVQDIFEFLLKDGYTIFIASNGVPAYLKAIVDYYHLDDWVSETYSIEQIESFSKSDLVKTILTKYGIEEAAVVGDRISDIKAAKDNGLTAVGCSFDFAKEEELSQADVVINDLIELRRMQFT